MNRTAKQTQAIMENDAAALAAELFDHFSSATTMRQVLGLYRNMCDAIGLRPNPLNDFYPKLKAKIKNWKAQALWKKFDARASHRVYNKGTACNGVRVLVIGAGPCGLRTAIEAQLLGAKVVVVEKRDRISRNNVLHLWPFVITDLRSLGAKKFYGKFCAGSIDHISIRQLQCILLKVALLLGVEVHEGVSFCKTIEPKDGCGWRAQVSPEDHAVSHYEFDVLIGADGKRNTLEGFKRKEFRGKLAIAITANFINKRTEAEAKAEEISGVAFIFNQSFFKELYQTTGIDLENIVYYKDETHYFVMTAKKHSLIDKGVIMQDYADPAELLAPNNVMTERLLDYAREAAEFSTKYQMPNLEFAVNHYGKPDVAMFDFTSMFAAENSSRIFVRKNYRLLQCLVGDSLLEPFWPTGSGCARGFLSSMDAAYACKLFANSRNSPLAVLAQRESIYRLLAQTTPENLHRDIGAYTLDPSTRYPNLNKTSVNVFQVKTLLDTDDVALLEQTFMDTNAIQNVPEQPVRRKRRTGDTTPLGTVLLRWIKSHLKGHEFSNQLTEVSQCFTQGEVLCALIHRYRPDLVDLNTIKDYGAEECNGLAFDIFEHELGIPRVMTPQDSIALDHLDTKLWLNYLEQICEVFRGEIPHVKHPKLDIAELKDKPGSNVPDFSKLLKFSTKKISRPMDVEMVNVNRRPSLDEERHRYRPRKFALEHIQAAQPVEAPRRAKKRRSHEKFQNIEERTRRQEEIAANRVDRQNKRRLHRAQQTQNFFKSLHMLQANTFLRETDSSTPFEDYSLYVYRQSAPEFNDRVKELERKLLYPDRERGIPSAMPRGAPDEQFNDRIKSMENKITSRHYNITEKKPKDLLRAIGKIESNDWNVREIEKKIEQSKKAEVGKSREKVPKWSREQFLARQNKMSRPIDRQESTDERFKQIDLTIKSLDKQLKEGHILEAGERGKNKVASIAGQFVKKDETPEEKTIQKSNSKVGLVFSSQGVSEICHFCKQKVYLMEKISAEGLVLHRSCLKCTHCHTNLRLGGYAFDRDSPDGLFYCTQHFRLPAKIVKSVSKRPSRPRAREDSSAKPITTTTEETNRAEGIATLDLLDRGQTPERIEFENADAMSDGEPSLENIIDENEWTDRNFGTGTDESESDFSTSESTDSESDSDIYEEAMGSPIGAQTLQLATEWIGKQRYSNIQDSDDDEFYDSSEDDEADTQTEGEELAKAREIRMQEVKLMPPVYPPTDTETEVQSETDSSSPDMEPNSATEISTDSEFDHDPVTRKPPQIFIDDTHLRRPTRVQVKQLMLENGIHRKQNNERHNHPAKEDLGIQLDIKPLVQVDPSVLSSNRMPLKNPRPGDYLLNKAPSTEGIASKKSLELKKRYLLGETGATGIMKSGSTSVLDSKLKNFHSNISECQKLLNPAAEISPAMQMFLKTSQLGNTNLVNGKTVEEKKEVEAKNIDEKENVYGLIMNNKNELLSKVGGIIETPKSATKDLEELSETINTALIENKMKDFTSVKKISGNDQKISIIDLTSIDFPQDMIKANQKFIDDLAKTGDESNGKHYEIIDLTVDTPVKDRSLEEKDEHFVTPMKLEIDEDAISKFSNKSDSKSDEEQPLISEHSKSVISEIVQSEDKVKENINEERPRSPAHETSIQVPTLISWDKKLKSQSDDLESDSLSSSSSSSLEEIPHYILDSATSPETQPGERFVPRLEVRDTSGELMQIDSLMIIDGKYVGDPEDLKLMEKLPEGTTIAANDNKDINTSDDDPNNKKDNCDIISNTTDTTTTISSTIVDNDKDKLDKNGDKNEKIASTFKYESLGSFKKKPDLKFDTRNENKIETLMNLPMIVSSDEIQSTTSVTIAKQQSIQKPTNLELNDKTNKIDLIDNDKTPTATMAPDLSVSDSETEFTGQVLTETELSDWTADDAVSENFVDIEFALNSNRGTIKRNKKSKKKHQQQAAQANQEKIVRQQQFKEKMEKEQEQRDNAAAECGIMKNLDIENIEFMDTGSDDSCVETYSTTNKAMLKNRGYVEFVTQTPAGEHTHKSYPSYRSDAGYSSSIRTSSSYHNYNDAYMNGSANKKLDVIEAVNKEIPGVDYIEQGACILTGDFDLKTPMNEIPRTPFGIGSLPLKFQHQSEQSDSLNDIEEDSLVMITSQATTTEESDALTVVTSPLDSTPRNNNPNSFSDAIRALSREDIFNVISSDKTSSLESKRSESRKSIEDKRRQSQDKLNTSIDDARRKTSEEMSYEDYVRKLQMKISQISNARDSIDIRKGKRKSSKGDLNVDQTLSENATTPTNKVLSIFGENIKEPPTVSMKLEEITKERAKQKDLIHDLVMDKLQSKKQLNAEKRLNRSRNRQMFSPGGNNSSTPTMTTPTSSCGSIPHCHPVPPERRNSKSKLFGEPERRHSVHATSPTTPTKIFLNNHQSPAKLKDRPLSDTVNCENIEPETPKLMKTQSFCAYTTRKTPNQEDAIIDEFKTPIPPPRFGRKYDDSVTQTEKLRQEARARARLKSNEDLGLSPDEKILLLRKKYNLDPALMETTNKSDDVKVHERKLIASKSVNDITAQNFIADENFNTRKQFKVIDYTSDPNLADGNKIVRVSREQQFLQQEQQQSSQQQQMQQDQKRNRARSKDPERRKSIIQTVSDFFHKKKDGSKEVTPSKERSEGVFGRFKISPKSKDKSKDKENTPFYERSKSSDCVKHETASFNVSNPMTKIEDAAPPIPPLPLNYQRSDDESYSTNENRELKKIKAITKASRQGELKRLRIAQEIQREQEEIEVQIKDYEARGVYIEKALRGEGQNPDLLLDSTVSMGANDEKLLKELLEIWRNITQLKKRDEELGIRQQELQLEHRHAQLKEQLNMRLSCSKLDKSSADVAAEGAILNEMLEIVAKRAALRPTDTSMPGSSHDDI